LIQNKKINDKDQLGDYLNDKTVNEMSDALDKINEFIQKNPDSSADKIQSQKDEFDKKYGKAVKKALAERDLGDFARNIRKRVDDEDDSLSGLSAEDKKKILDASQELEEWLKKNPNATAEEIDKKKKEIENKIKDIVDKADKKKELEDKSKELRNRAHNVDDALNKYTTGEDKRLIHDSTKDALETAENGRNGVEEVEYEDKRLDTNLNPTISRANEIDNLEKLASETKKKD